MLLDLCILGVRPVGGEALSPSHPKQTVFSCRQGATLWVRGCCASVVARAKILAVGLQEVGEGLFLLGRCSL